MLIAEEFERCEKCGQGWFEKKTFVLVSKKSGNWGKTVAHKTEVQYHCAGCGHIQYKHNDDYDY